MVDAAGIVGGEMLKGEFLEATRLPATFDDFTGLAIKIAKEVADLASMPLGRRAKHIERLLRQTLQESVVEIAASLFSDERIKRIARKHNNTDGAKKKEIRIEKVFVSYEKRYLANGGKLKKTSKAMLTLIFEDTEVKDKLAESYLRDYPDDRMAALKKKLAETINS